MKVSSPVGDFPFEPTRLKVAQRSLVIEGTMGAWPARVQVELRDIPALLRLVPLPVIAVVGAVLITMIATQFTRRGR